jgi:hypothetical protein
MVSVGAAEATPRMTAAAVINFMLLENECVQVSRRVRIEKRGWYTKTEPV